MRGGAVARYARDPSVLRHLGLPGAARGPRLALEPPWRAVFQIRLDRSEPEGPMILCLMPPSRRDVLLASAGGAALVPDAPGQKGLAGGCTTFLERSRVRWIPRNVSADP